MSKKSVKSESSNRLKEAIAKREEALKEINGVVSTVLLENFKELFDKYPNLVSFSWKQYTPYFNDGDTCTFGVGRGPDEISTEFTEDNGERVDSYDRAQDSVWDSKLRKSIPKEVPELDKTAHSVENAVSEILSEIPKDSFKELYGDHVAVIVTREGITTDEYEHD